MKTDFVEKELIEVTSLILKTLTAFFFASLIMGPSVSAAPKSGQSFGDWVFECTAIAEGETSCFLVQTIISQKTKKQIARFTIGSNPNSEGKRFVAFVPLGISIEKGVVLSIDSGDQVSMVLKTCIAQGCVAAVDLSETLAAALSRGKVFQVRFEMNRADSPIALKGSLIGITDAFKDTGWF